jgi:hypothetical protein
MIKAGHLTEREPNAQNNRNNRERKNTDDFVGLPSDLLQISLGAFIE